MADDEVERVVPEDDEVLEVWSRRTDDEFLGVGAQRLQGIAGWQVSVGLAEFVREEPMESALRRQVAEALASVPQVTAVSEDDREVWAVSGHPDGRALVEAVIPVVDALADQARHHFG